MRAVPLAVTFGHPSTLFGVLTGRRAGSTVAIAQDPFPYGDGYKALTDDFVVEVERLRRELDEERGGP